MFIFPFCAKCRTQAETLAGSAEQLRAEVTAREEAEVALRISEERYRAICETSADYAFSICSTEDGIVEFEWLTDSFSRVTGYAVDEVMGKPNPWRIYVHPDDFSILQSSIGGWSEGTMTQREFRIRKKDGEVRWVRSFTRPVFDPQGRLVRVWGSTQDVTEYKRAGAALRETQERLALAIRGAIDGLWDWDIISNEVYYSPRFAELLGLEEHELAPSSETFSNESIQKKQRHD